MRRQEETIKRPEGLIAYRRGEDTLLQWNAVENASGYYAYFRKNESSDGNYSSFAYNKINEKPVKEPRLYDENRDVTYRVTAVDGQGKESAMSDMVFPVSHEGLEILSIRYFSEGEILTRLPNPSVTIAVTAVNSCAEDIEAALRAEWDGGRQDFPLTFPADGLLHEYPVSVGGVKEGPVVAAVYDGEEVLISCISRFRPKGLQLYDTLFEKGLLICEPFTAVLYEQKSGPVPEAALLNGQEFDNCHICFCLSGKGGGESFVMRLGGLTLQVNHAWTIQVSDSTGVLGSICRKEERNSLVLHFYTGGDTFRIFVGEEHTPALLAATAEGRGRLLFTAGAYEISGLQIVSQKPSFAGVYEFQKGSGLPVWNIACWHSRFNWIKDGKRDEAKRFEDGSILIENPGRSFFLAPGGREVTLQARGSMEYEHTRRAQEGWTHLLLEVLWDRQPCGRLQPEGLQNLWLTMDIRILQCENKTDGCRTDIHAGQFVVYFNISGIGNEAMWLGLCNFDNRFLAGENRKTLVCQMDNGTNTFIIAPPQSRFVAGSMADGQWHSMSIDLKPVIFEAYEAGKSIGAFARSGFRDLRLNSMNLGFEIPGSLDMAVKLSNLQLTAVPSENADNPCSCSSPRPR